MYAPDDQETMCADRAHVINKMCVHVMPHQEGQDYISITWNNLEMKVKFRQPKTLKMLYINIML